MYSSATLTSRTDPGFEALGIDELLAPNAEMVKRIRLCFGIDRESFERDVLSLIQNYARCVHLLPATPDNHFHAPGGLLRLGLEVAFFSLQATDAHIFAGRSTISVRRQLEPRWRLATFIAGLCCELHRPLGLLTVVDADGTPWPGYLQPLGTWLHQGARPRYHVRWRPQAAETRGLGLIALPQVVPPALLQYLDEDNQVIVPHLLASVGGAVSHRDHNVLDSLVRRSLALVINRNLQADADRYGAPQFGSHLERFLVDALRRLATTDANWTPNRDRSRVWCNREGLFLAWPQAAADVQALLEADQLSGIPKSPDTVLELLLAGGIVEPQGTGNAIWTIMPPGSKAPIDAVKLASNGILYSAADRPPKPLHGRLVCALTDKPEPPPESPQPPPDHQFSLLTPEQSPIPAPAPAMEQTAAAENNVPPPSAATVDPLARARPDPAAELSPALSPAPSPALSPAPMPASLPTPAPSSLQTTVRLRAPMRLNPALRLALTRIVDTLNGPLAVAAAHTISTGLFVPLPALQRQGIQPAVAMRGLSDAGMLVHPQAGGPPTVSRESEGTTTLGLVVDPRFIEGFDLEAFIVPPTPLP